MALRHVPLNLITSPPTKTTHTDVSTLFNP
ncbi:hypothetical protein FGSG_12775 [Fusarium graminearum PH-1]|nr:hypothetical protein FGSG_12775 [Fusarium graminearum PH-1]ESU11646.1 hypothetical protein FGSG_12775 [Fusarium graminearum PH-1]|eukprot:XP_011324222.1 hypothetical protein FGSG_12775 [Fusarium graminearum PH-1]